MNKTTIILLSIIAAMLVAGAFIGGWFSGKAKRITIIERDTTTTVVTIRDTVTQYQPKYITKEVIRSELVYLKDTIRVQDSTFVVMPIEKRVYEDTNYRAVVSGIKPSLDEISVYPKTQVVTTTITQTIKEPSPLVSLTLQGGVGGQYDLIHKTWGFGPYVGGGISIRLARRR